MKVLAVLRVIDAAFAAAPPVPCRAGCAACCHGPFDISPADAKAVEAGMEALDSAMHAQVVSRAREEIAAFQHTRPDWQAPYDVESLGEADFDIIAHLRADEPCPALSDAGACTLYQHRPSTCRLMGRPWVTADGGVLANACPIKEEFPGYAAMPPTPIDLEMIESALDAIDALHVGQGSPGTTIAGAIVRWAGRGTESPGR